MTERPTPTSQNGSRRRLTVPAPSSEVAIPAGPAILTWFSAWLAVNLVAVPGVFLILGADLANPSAADSLVGLAVQWAVFIGSVVFASKQFGTGAVTADLGLRVRPLDLVGVPLGVLTQWLVLPLVYWPLQQAWPDTFSPESLEERSRGLIDGAGGFVLVMIAIAAVLGAPLVEEIVYRGLLQRSLSRPLTAIGAWIVTSVLFAAIHISPVDFVGLLVAGLLFGAGVLVTGRIGFGLCAHIGFNAFAMSVLLATR